MKSRAAVLRAVRAALLADPRVSSRCVKVRIHRGRVVLSGRVGAFLQKEAAQGVVVAIAPEMPVRNNIEVLPNRILPDHQAAENVREAIELHPRLVKEAIAVSVVHGIVTLKGTVASAAQRARAEDAAVAIPGVRRVHDLLWVDPRGQRTDAAIARDVRAAIHLTPGLRNQHVRVAVAGRVIVLSGFVQDQRRRSHAEQIARRFALNTVRNEIVIRRGRRISS